MASNLKISEECIKLFNALKANKEHGYVIMCIQGDKEVVVEEIGEPFPASMTQDENELAFKELTKKLLAKEDEPKFVLFDFKLHTDDGKREKVVFVNWCSDQSPFRKKMLQGSTCESLKKSFQGLAASVQANDQEELDYANIRKELLAGKK